MPENRVVILRVINLRIFSQYKQCYLFILAQALIKARQNRKARQNGHNTPGRCSCEIILTRSLNINLFSPKLVLSFRGSFQVPRPSFCRIILRGSLNIYCFPKLVLGIFCPSDKAFRRRAQASEETKSILYRRIILRSSLNIKRFP